MAYAVPNQWAHGDTVSAADMNKYSDSLNALYAILGDAKINHAQLWSYENYDAVNFVGSDYYLFHRYRYLVYRSDAAGNGDVIDPSGVGATLTLPDSEGAIVTYDLTMIDWLTPGKLYQIEDCVFAMESRSG